MSRRPLVIVGPTASGKTALALALAERHGGAEIVSVDAMAVYRGMDIGTAKPTPDERARVPHHLVDVCDPTEEFDMARFQELTAEALASIESAGQVAILVGGTGLYVRAVVDGFATPGRFPEVLAELESEPDTAALHRRLERLDPIAAHKMEPTNRRRIVRALEVTIGGGRPFSSYGPGVDHYGATPYVQIGLELDRSVLDGRIEDRYRRQLEQGFLDEVRALPPALSRTASQALGYRELLQHVRGDQPLEVAVAQAKQRTRRFARRQQRWFRRDPRIHWLDATAPDLVDRADRLWAEYGKSGVGGAVQCETGGR